MIEQQSSDTVNLSGRLVTVCLAAAALLPQMMQCLWRPWWCGCTSRLAGSWWGLYTVGDALIVLGWTCMNVGYGRLGTSLVDGLLFLIFTVLCNSISPSSGSVGQSVFMGCAYWVGWIGHFVHGWRAAYLRSLLVLLCRITWPSAPGGGAL